MHPTHAMTVMVIAGALSFAVAHCFVVLRPRTISYTLGINKRVAGTLAIATVLVVLAGAINYTHRDSYGFWETLVTILTIGFDVVAIGVCSIQFWKNQRRKLSLSHTTLAFLLIALDATLLQHAAIVSVGSVRASGFIGLCSYLSVFSFFMSLVSAVLLINYHERERNRRA